jgi:hypothetical protein
MKWRAGPEALPVAVAELDEPVSVGEHPAPARIRRPAKIRRHNPRKKPGTPEESCMVFMGSD